MQPRGSPQRNVTYSLPFPETPGEVKSRIPISLVFVAEQRARRRRPSPFSQNIIRESGFNANSLRPLFRLIFYKNLHSAAIRVPTRNHARTPPPSGKRKRRPFSGRTTVTGCKKRCILFHTPLDNRPPGRHTNRNCRKGPPNHPSITIPFSLPISCCC